MSTHLREQWRQTIQRVASTGLLYHLTSKVDFRLDPKKVPADNALSIRERVAAGLFLTDNVERWVNGHGYWRPWVVEVDVPAEVLVDERWGGEKFLPAEHFDRLSITRVLPLDAHCREEFGEYGWTESFFGTTFDTGEPVDHDARFPFRGWRYPGDARHTDPAWQAAYKQRVRDYAREVGR